MSLELYKKLRSLKVNIKLQNDTLDIKGPKGAITPEILSEIKENKLSLMQLIRDFADQKATHNSIPLAEPSDNYPLSSAQFRLWMLSQFEEGNVAYNDIDIFIFEGELDFNLLKRSFTTLIERHESLRTVFRYNENGEIRQFILPAAEAGFQPVSVDLRKHQNKDDELKRLIQADLTYQFDLSAGPLLQTHLYQTENHKWIFTYVIHHIINDSWSTQILMKELFQVYNSYLLGKPIPLTPLRIQYKDYAVWQHNLSKESGWAAHKSYWLSQLEAPIPVLELIPDKPRPLIKTYNGGLVSFVIANPTISILKAFCTTEGGTLFMGLVATLNTLFHRYTGQNDIMLGSPIAGREHVDLEDQIGVYTNTLTLRTRFNNNDCFKDLFKTTKSVTLGAYEHQAYQFDELVNDLQPVRDMSRSALFDVMIVLQNAEAVSKTHDASSAPESNSFSISRFNEGEHTRSKFDLTFSFTEQEGEFRMNIEYNSDLFFRSTAERMGSHFISILNAALSHPEIPVHQLDYLSSDEQNHLLNVFDNTKAQYPEEKTIIKIFEEQVARTPQQTALTYLDITLSYSALNQKVNHLAHYLRQVHNIKANDLVAVKLDRSEWMVITLLAILKSGGAYVPIDIEYPSERIEYILSDCKCKLLIDEKELDTFRNTADIYNPSNPDPVNTPDDRAYVIYTSGTTGQPKGVIIGHRQVVRLFKTEPCFFDFNEQDVWTMFHSYSFDFSVWEMYGALLYGGKLVVVPAVTARDPQAFLKLLNNEGVTVLNQTPSSFYNLIKDEEGTTGSSLRYVIFGGEALSPAKLYSWNKKNPLVQLINMYGITETTVHVTYKKIGKKEIEENISTIGTPIPTLSCYVLDQHKKLVPAGIAGELYIGGDGLAHGYLNKAQLTQERFIENPYKKGERLYKSGDLARILQDKGMEYLGRNDAQVKIRGYRIELGEITNCLQRFEKITDAVVLARTESDGKILVAYFISDSEIKAEEIRNYARSVLPAYMVPSHFIQVKEFKLTTNGKLNTAELPAPGVTENTEYTAPGNPVQKQLTHIWSDILHIDAEKISIHSKFFDIGGHSLRIGMLISRVQKLFGTKLSFTEVFKNSTIAQIARIIEESEKEHLITIEPASNKPYYIPSSSQHRLYLLQELNPDSIAYNMAMEIIVQKQLDPEKLKSAFISLIARHDSLRTSFESFDGNLFQKIHDNIYFETEFHEIRMEELDQLRQNFTRPFNLSAAPLFRAAHVKINDSEDILMVDIHHIVSDAISLEILEQEFNSLYNGIKLQPLRLQYKDYSEWVNSTSEKNRIEDQLQFWKNQFKDEIPVIKLPYDFNRPVKQVFSGSYFSFRLTDPENEIFRNICKSEQVTPFMFFLSLTNIFLSRISNQYDIVIGCPVTTRKHPDLEKIIGMFVNTITLRNFPDGDKRYNHFLQELKKGTLLAYENQEYPFENLVEEIVKRRDFSRNPLFDVMFALQNHNGKINESKKIYTVGKHIKLESKFDLTIEANEFSDGIIIGFEYNSALFRPETIELFAEYIKCIIGSIGKDTSLHLKNIEILPEKEKKKLILDFNSSCTEYPSKATLHQLFQEQVQLTPHSPAVVFQEFSLSYEEVNSKANKIASHLIELGVKTGDIVALHLQRSELLIPALLGILKSGAAYLPLDTDYPEERKKYMLKDSCCKYILHAGTNNFIYENSIFIDVKDIISGNYTYIANPLFNTSSSNLAYIIYTSGSTGKPKGVMIEHKSVINLVWQLKKRYELSETDRMLLFSSISFDASVQQIFTALFSGACLIIPAKETLIDPLEFSDLLLREKITHLDCVPSFLSILDSGKNYYLKRIISGGEACPLKLARVWSEKVDFYNEYGPTETTVTCTQYSDNNLQLNNLSFIPIGKPLSNVQCYILDYHKNPLPVGAEGELYIGGDCLARGYLNNPDLTDEKFIKNPFNNEEKIYRTGDMAKWLPDGNIEFIGRKDGQVKIRGYRIELAEIERALLDTKQPDEVLVLTNDTEIGEKELIAYLINVTETGLKEVQKRIRETLPSHMIPSAYVRMSAFPLTINGKIDKTKLPKPESSIINGKAENQIPTDEIELQLISIWKDILSKENLNVSSSFFEMGGQSIRVAKLVSAVFKRFNVKLKLSDIFANAILKEQASLIRNQIQKQHKSIIYEINEHQQEISDNTNHNFTDRMKNKKAIFILPYAGGSSYSMVGLEKHLRNIDVLPLEPPGRGKRIKEPLMKNIHDVVNDLYSQIQSIINLYDQYYFFGHSMGTLTGYLLINKLNENGSKLPSHFFVSGRGGPSKIDRGDECEPKYHLLPSDEFREKLRIMGGCPEEVLNDSDLMDFFEPIIKADFELVENYEHKELPPFNVPITGFFGDTEKTKREDMELWKKETTNNLEIVEMKGNHFFIFDSWPAIGEKIMNIVNIEQL